VFEQGRVDDPEELPLAAVARLRNEPDALGDLETEVGEDGVHQRGLAELEDDDVALLGACRSVDGGAKLIRDGLRERRLCPGPVRGDLGARETTRAHAARALLELVSVRAREI